MKNNSAPVLSVITLTFNNLDELKTTLKSIENLNLIESVVINGGADPEAKKYLGSRPDITSLSEPDKGISDAFNKGIKQSNGSLITFLNSGDVLIDTGYYKFVIDYLIQNPGIDFIYADITYNHPVLGKFLFKPSRKLAQVPFPHPSLIVRRKVFEKIGGFDLNLKVAMDFDFMQRMNKLQFKGYYYKTGPVVLMDGTGASSAQGFRGLQECELVLRRLGILNFNSLFYFRKQAIKMHVRNWLGKFKLLKAYDYLKCRLLKTKQDS